MCIGNNKLYVLVKAPVREAHKARGVAECFMRLRDPTPSAIFSKTTRAKPVL